LSWLTVQMKNLHPASESLEILPASAMAGVNPASFMP